MQVVRPKAYDFSKLPYRRRIFGHSAREGPGDWQMINKNYFVTNNQMAPEDEDAR